MFDNGFNSLMDLFNVNVVFFIIVLIALAFIYFAPVIIAVQRKKKQWVPIFLLDLFAGWTGLGWLAALIWSTIKEESDNK